MIEKLKTLYPSVNEHIVQQALEDANEDFLELTNRESVPEGALSLVLLMARENINISGSEGLTSATLSGVSMSSNGDYSDKVKNRLNKYKRIRLVQSGD